MLNKQKYWLFIHLSVMITFWALYWKCVYLGASDYTIRFSFSCAMSWPILMALNGNVMPFDHLDEMNKPREGFNNA